MYSPTQDGIEKSVNQVQYTAAKPPAHLSEFVDCFWELKTKQPLEKDFYLHVLPDACVNILLNQKEPNIAGVTAIRTTFEVLNLGTSFHYVGIQFLPGVWQGSRIEIFDSYVGVPYQGSLPLVETNNKIVQREFLDQQLVLIELTEELIKRGLVQADLVIQKIIANISKIHSVADMSTLTGISARQLQRILKESTGFSPHDFLKVLRLQHSFKKHYATIYVDQPHFIREFRKATGYTPAQYMKKFDV